MQTFPLSASQQTFAGFCNATDQLHHCLDCKRYTGWPFGNDGKSFTDFFYELAEELADGIRNFVPEGTA